MKIGLQIPEFTWPGGPAEIAATLAKVVRAADRLGFDYISVMDHFFQIPELGPADNDMLEAYTTLGFIAAHTERARLLTVVTGAFFRYPGVLAKTITTLDVLSGGRAMLGLGAGWHDVEAHGLGIPFPPVAERFGILEDTLELTTRMWRGDRSPFHGHTTDAELPLGVPLPLSRPHPPIMVGGAGEKKTLRLVARYAQACNMFPGPDLPRKLDVLREHCVREGRDYDEIEKTSNFIFDFGGHGEKIDDNIAELHKLADHGIQTVITGVPKFWEIDSLELVGEQIIPAVAPF